MVTNESNSNIILKKRPRPTFARFGRMVGEDSQNAPISEGAYPENTGYKTYENLDQSIPKGYKFDVPTKYKSAPTPTTKFSSLSEQLGGGEYAHDPKNRGLLVQSYREDDYLSREKLRAGRSSRLFQVDHILPLSLGGTDNAKNKEVLSNRDHAQKTKVGAIARTLWYDDKISYPEAQVLALNWRDKDVNDIILDEKGVIVGENPTGIAQNKIVEWQKPPKVSFSDWWTEIKGAPKAMLDKISKKVESVPAIELGDSIAAQFGEGLISQLALGYIPVEKETYEDASKQFAGNAAQMVGQMTGVIGSFMGLGLAARGIAAALGVSARAAKYVSATTKIAKTISKVPKVTIGQVRVAKALNNMGLFALHGQLSKQEQKGFDERAKRLLSDASFGAILSMPGKGLKGSARLWMGAFTVSAAFDPEDLNSALMNATVVTALHGLGKISSKNNLGKEVINIAIETRKKFGLETRNIKEKPYTSKELDIDVKSSIKKIRKTANSPEEAEAEILNLLQANRELYKAGLDSKTREIVEQQEAVELQRKAVSGELENIGKLPKETIDIVDDFKAPKTKDIPKKQSAQQDNIVLEQPTGITPATGINVSNSISRQNLVNFIEGGAKKGDAVRLVIRDEEAMTNLLKGKNYKYPEKSVQIIDISNGPGTAKGIGYVPRKSKIIEIGKSRESASFLPEGPKELPYNPSLNKNTYYDAMTRNGVRQMSATVERIGKSSNGMPYFEIKVTPENWAETIAVKAAKTSEVVKTMKVTKGAREKMKSKLMESTGATDMIKSNKEIVDTDNAALVSSIIKDFETAIASGDKNSILKVFKEVFKSGISKERAETLATDPTRFTVGRLFNFIKDGYVEEALTNTGKSIYDVTFSDVGYYTALSKADRAYIDSLKIVGNKKIGETVKSVVTKIKPRVESTPREKVRVTVEKSQQKLPPVKAQEPLPKVLSSKAKVGEIKQEIKLEKATGEVGTKDIQAYVDRKPGIQGVLTKDGKTVIKTNLKDQPLENWLTEFKQYKHLDKTSEIGRIGGWVRGGNKKFATNHEKAHHYIEIKSKESVSQDLKGKIQKEFNKLWRENEPDSDNTKLFDMGIMSKGEGRTLTQQTNLQTQNGIMLNNAKEEIANLYALSKENPEKLKLFNTYKDNKVELDKLFKEIDGVSGAAKTEAAAISEAINKRPSLGEEPGPLKVGKVDPKLIQEKISKRPVIEPEVKEYERVKNEIRRFIDEYEPIGYEDPKKSLKFLERMVSNTVKDRNTKLNEVDRNRLIEQMNSYANDKKIFLEKTGRKDAVDAEFENDFKPYKKEEKYGSITRLGSLFKNYISGNKKSLSDADKVWEGTYKELVKKYGENVKDIPLSKEAIDRMTQAKYKLTPDVVNMGKKILDNKFEGLPKDILAKVKSVQDMYPKTRIYFSPTSMGNRFPSISYNMFGDVISVIKKPQFIEMLKEFGITKIKKSEQPLVVEFLKTGNKKHLPRKLADVVEKHYQDDVHLNIKDKAIVNSEFGENWRVITFKDLVGEQEFSPLTWSLSTIEKGTKKSDAEIDLVIKNLLPQFMNLVNSGKSIKVSTEANKISESTKDILELLNKTKS